MMRGKMPTRFGLVKFERNCNFLFGWTLPWPVFMNHQLFSLLHDCSKFLIFLFTFFPLVLFFASFPLPLPFPCHVRLTKLKLIFFYMQTIQFSLKFYKSFIWSWEGSTCLYKLAISEGIQTETEMQFPLYGYLYIY